MLLLVLLSPPLYNSWYKLESEAEAESQKVRNTTVRGKVLYVGMRFSVGFDWGFFMTITVFKIIF